MEISREIHQRHLRRRLQPTSQFAYIPITLGVVRFERRNSEFVRQTEKKEKES